MVPSKLEQSSNHAPCLAPLTLSPTHLNDNAERLTNPYPQSNNTLHFRFLIVFTASINVPHLPALGWNSWLLLSLSLSITPDKAAYNSEEASLK